MADDTITDDQSAFAHERRSADAGQRARVGVTVGEWQLDTEETAVRAVEDYRTAVRAAAVEASNDEANWAATHTEALPGVATIRRFIDKLDGLGWGPMP